MTSKNKSMVLLLVLMCWSLSAATGCVRRTMTITTAPEGARVILNDEEIGTSPISKDFTWFGDYDVVIKQEGYKTLNTHHRIDAPWYQIPPIDFIAEVLVPFPIHYKHEVHFDLEPVEPIDRDQLIENAREFRERTLYATE